MARSAAGASGWPASAAVNHISYVAVNAVSNILDAGPPA